MPPKTQALRGVLRADAADEAAHRDYLENKYS